MLNYMAITAGWTWAEHPYSPLSPNTQAREAYDRAGTSPKRATNELIFTKPLPDEISDHELNDAVRDVVITHNACPSMHPRAQTTAP